MEEQILLRKLTIQSINASNIDTTILNKLKKNIEGKCTADGYIHEIKEIINRTQGIIDINDIAGSIKYDISFRANVINVHKNDIIVGCVVKLITTTGVFLQKDNYIRVFIPADYINDEYNQNDIVNIIVLASKCDIGNNIIEIVAKPHYYHINEENERLLIFPPKDDKKLDNLDYKTTTIRSSIRNTCHYGYNPNIEELKKLIDDISPDIWRFYRSLLNPTELVYAPAAYSTFKLNPKNDLVPSRAYYKLWEIIQKFPDAFNMSAKNVLNLCENPCGFTKALIDFNTKTNKKTQNYTIVSLKDGIKANETLLKKYKKDITTVDIDITDYASFNKLIKMYSSKKAEIITGDGGIKLMDGQFDEEHEMGVLKYCEAVAALSCQASGGTFVLKLFDSCSQLIVDLIYILYNCYESVSIYKPSTSRPASSERYIIASNFMGIDKNLLNKLQSLIKDKPIYIMQLFKKEYINTDKTYLNLIKAVNQRLQKNQMKKIKEMIDTIAVNDFKRPSKEVIVKMIKKQEEIAIDWGKSHNV